MAATRSSKSSTPASPSKTKFTPLTKTKTKSKPTTTTSNKTSKSTSTNKQKKTQQKQLTPSPTPTSSSPSNRNNKSLGVRLIRGRIYDSQNGKSCHQCRQKTIDFAVPCKSQSCAFRFCHTCLLNRYGEKAEEMAALGDWKCPKCRGICNCSKCMTKRGCCPTGRLVDAAKASGYSLVSEILQLKNSEKANKEDTGSSPKDENASMQEGKVALPLRRKHRKENGVDGKSYSNFKHKSYGDDENNEKLQTEILGKKDSSEKETKKTMEVADAGVSPKMLTTFKELGGASTKILKAGSDSKLQPKHLKLNSNENKSQNGKLKSLSKAGANDNSMESNKEDAALPEKRSSKKCRISEEVHCREEKACRGDDGGQLKKLKSDMHDPKRNHTRANKMEGSEEKLAHKGASMCKQVNEFHKCQQNTVQLQVKDSEVEIPLPQGIKLTNVAKIDLPAEDIGHALQFLEFCEAFGKVLDLKKGQPECLLREIAFGRNLRCSQGSLVIQFHIKLLSMIQNDSGKKYFLKTEGRNSWLQELNRCISESHYQSQELLDCFNLVADGYGELSFSKKLRLLNFLCDEVLGTVELRSWIDEQNLELIEEEKKEKLMALEKERNMKMQLQNEVATILVKGNAPHSVSEYQDLVSNIKAEAAQILAETLQAKNTVMKKEKQRSNAVRSEPMLLDGNGLKFWKLISCSGKRDILLQDIGLGDSITLVEKWFSFNVEDGPLVEKYISGKLSE